MTVFTAGINEGRNSAPPQQYEAEVRGFITAFVIMVVTEAAQVFVRVECY